MKWFIVYIAKVSIFLIKSMILYYFFDIACLITITL